LGQQAQVSIMALVFDLRALARRRRAAASVPPAIYLPAPPAARPLIDLRARLATATAEVFDAADQALTVVAMVEVLAIVAFIAMVMLVGET
jgi:hypothetical protein